MDDTQTVRVGLGTVGDDTPTRKIEIDLKRLRIGDMKLLAHYARLAARGGLTLDEMQPFLSLLDRIFVGGVSDRPLTDLTLVLDWLVSWAKEEFKNGAQRAHKKPAGGKRHGS